MITSGGLEPVADEGKEGRSVFAYFLVKHLETLSENYTTAAELYNVLFKKVSNASFQSYSDKIFFISSPNSFKLIGLTNDLIAPNSSAISKLLLPNSLPDITMIGILLSICFTL